MQQLDANAKYKYIDTLHSCESLATDVFTYANFSKHYSNYFTKNELVYSNFVKEVMLKNQIHIEAETFTTPERKTINAIFERILVSDFRTKLPKIVFFKNSTFVLNDEKQTIIYNLYNISDDKQNEILKLVSYIDIAFEKIREYITFLLNEWSDIFEFSKNSFDSIFY